MRKIKIYPVLAALLAMVFSGQASLAATTVNYGTTTFFSDEKDVKPPVEKPIYDIGVRGGKEPGDDGSSDGGDDGSSSGSGGSLFDQVITGVGSFFSGSSASDNSSEGSLFDLQKDFGRDADGNLVDMGEFIMGARGESYENMDADDIDGYNSRIADKFNFKDNVSVSAPKKSKLLFTNIVVPVDLTTQYVIIIMVILIAVGLAVGYYFWKKEMEKMNRKPKEENYD
ncbi:MAG: hypothetical protein Q8L10_03905 [Candidatus Moranbacteria bacterium]|nr:hypothetical protein [Candidatus Moranbacteria bacterium]